MGEKMKYPLKMLIVGLLIFCSGCNSLSRYSRNDNQIINQIEQAGYSRETPTGTPTLVWVALIAYGRGTPRCDSFPGTKEQFLDEAHARNPNHSFETVPTTSDQSYEAVWYPGPDSYVVFADSFYNCNAAVGDIKVFDAYVSAHALNLLMMQVTLSKQMKKQMNSAKRRKAVEAILDPKKMRESVQRGYRAKWQEQLSDDDTLRLTNEFEARYNYGKDIPQDYLRQVVSSLRRNIIEESKETSD